MNLPAAHVSYVLYTFRLMVTDAADDDESVSMDFFNCGAVAEYDTVPKSFPKEDEEDREGKKDKVLG